MKDSDHGTKLLTFLHSRVYSRGICLKLFSMGIFLFVVVAALPAAPKLLLASILHLHSRLFLSILISSSQQCSVLLLLCILLEWQFHHLTHLIQHVKKAGKGARYGEH
jgi:hypothetical protein